MFIMMLHNSLFISPEPCQEWRTVGRLCNVFIGQAGQEHCGISWHCTSRFEDYTAYGDSQQSVRSNKRAPDWVYKNNVGHEGSPGAI
jgi:hypothetical protein